MAQHRRQRPAVSAAGLRENDLAEQADLLVDSPTPAEQQAVAVYDNRRLLGHVARVEGRGRVWRADGIPLGIFPTRDKARAAVIKAGRWPS